MKKPYDVDTLSGLDAGQIQHLRELSLKYFELQDSDLPQYVKQVISIILRLQDIHDTRLLASNIAVFFDASFAYLCQQRKNLNSELYFFLRIINHIPILESSPFFSQTLDLFRMQFRKNPTIIKTFDKLQTLYLFEELGYRDGALELVSELETLIPKDDLNLFTLLQLCRFRLLEETEDLIERLELALYLIHRVYHAEGAESTIYIILQWLKSFRWLKTHEVYKAMLYNLFEELKDDPGLNSATVAFELFELSNRLVDPQAKMQLYLDLISYPANLLNIKQLTDLHFFAGNYMSGCKEQFRDSINSFKSSNYFLHKSWERLVEISKYVRSHITPSVFKTAVFYLEQKFLQLSHHTSIRNNCFVENLQASFDAIEDLYKEKEQLSLTDSLTGLKNRRYQELNLPQLVYFGARHSVHICFAMADIDMFKLVNDDFGHIAGDQVLKELAQMMQSAFRKSDIIIRYGGEEFLLVLFGSDIKNAAQVLDNFRMVVKDKVFHHENEEIRITISIGYCCKYFDKQDHDADINCYIKAADEALLLAKRSGRNMIKRYENSKKNES